MNGGRNVTIFAAELDVLEELGHEFIRRQDISAGMWLHTFAVRLREQTGFRRDESAFVCDVDESAGMAEVVELHGYSRKVPCK